MKEKIIRLVRIMGEPFGEIVWTIAIDDLIINSIRISEDNRDFEVNVWNEDIEITIGSEYLTDEDMNHILVELEDLLIKY